MVGPLEALMGTRVVSYKLEVHAVCAKCGLHFVYMICAHPTRIFKFNLGIRCCMLKKWGRILGKT